MAASCGSGTGGLPILTEEPVTVEFATAGLGAELEATNSAVAAFEKVNPGIHVNILTLGADVDTQYDQLRADLEAGQGTPDVMSLDVILPAGFAKAGQLASLDSFHPQVQSFFPAQVSSGMYQGHIYAIPWFINTEGVYYRTDIISQLPANPLELVRDAQAADRGDPDVKYGFAFEGVQREGLVTAFMNVAGGFGGGLDLHHLYSPENVKALDFMRDAIYVNGIASPTTPYWGESQVQDAFLAGNAAFAMNWPYLFQLAESPGSVVQGKTDWFPFPAVAGQPKAAPGGAMLAINSRSLHGQAAWKLIQYLLSDQVQIDRAVVAGDPPAVRSAYGASLFDRAPYYQAEEKVFGTTTSRPVSPEYYPRISRILQARISDVLNDKFGAPGALALAQQQIDDIVGP